MRRIIGLLWKKLFTTQQTRSPGSGGVFPDRLQQVRDRLAVLSRVAVLLHQDGLRMATAMFSDPTMAVYAGHTLVQEALRDLQRERLLLLAEERVLLSLYNHTS